MGVNVKLAEGDGATAVADKFVPYPQGGRVPANWPDNRAICVRGRRRGWVGYFQPDGDGNTFFCAACKASIDELLDAVEAANEWRQGAGAVPTHGTLYDVFEALKKTLPPSATPGWLEWVEANAWNALVAARRSCKFNLLADEELSKARAAHGSFPSYHHFASVIREEFEEFWDIVKMKSEKRDGAAALKELVQIASSCRRAAEDLKLVDG